VRALESQQASAMDVLRLVEGLGQRMTELERLSVQTHQTVIPHLPTSPRGTPHGRPQLSPRRVPLDTSLQSETFQDPDTSLSSTPRGRPFSSRKAPLDTSLHSEASQDERISSVEKRAEENAMQQAANMEKIAKLIKGLKTWKDEYVQVKVASEKTAEALLKVQAAQLEQDKSSEIMRHTYDSVERRLMALEASIVDVGQNVASAAGDSASALEGVGFLERRLSAAEDLLKGMSKVEKNNAVEERLTACLDGLSAETNKLVQIEMRLSSFEETVKSSEETARKVTATLETVGSFDTRLTKEFVEHRKSVEARIQAVEHANEDVAKKVHIWRVDDTAAKLDGRINDIAGQLSNAEAKFREGVELNNKLEHRTAAVEAWNLRGASTTLDALGQGLANLELSTLQSTLNTSEEISDLQSQVASLEEKGALLETNLRGVQKAIDEHFAEVKAAAEAKPNESADGGTLASRSEKRLITLETSLRAIARNFDSNDAEVKKQISDLKNEMETADHKILTSQRAMAKAVDKTDITVTQLQAESEAFQRQLKRIDDVEIAVKAVTTLDDRIKESEAAIHKFQVEIASLDVQVAMLSRTTHFLEEQGIMEDFKADTPLLSPRRAALPKTFLGATVSKTLFVVTVPENSSASRLGIEAGDCILGLNGLVMKSAEDLHKFLSTRKHIGKLTMGPHGTPVKLRRRTGQIETIHVSIEEI